MPAIFIREMEQYIKYSIFFILKIGWLKGKQVRFLYDLVTVIRECRYESFTPLARIRREGKYLHEDLSARKPASYDSTGRDSGSRVIGRTFVC